MLSKLHTLLVRNVHAGEYVNVFCGTFIDDLETWRDYILPSGKSALTSVSIESH